MSAPDIWSHLPEWRTRLAEYEELWLWHEQTDDLLAGYGAHMSQMLYRLPVDGQTRDMQASIERMIADLASTVAALEHLNESS